MASKRRYSGASLGPRKARAEAPFKLGPPSGLLWRRRLAMARRRAAGPVVGEMHSYDVALTDDVTTTPSITIVNAMAQGTDSDDREGRKIHMQSLMVKLHITNEADNTKYSDLMRVMVVYDKQANKAAPVIGDLLDATTMVANKNINNRDRFTVLGDEIVHLKRDAAYSATVGVYSWYYERFFQLRNKQTTYSDAAAGVGSVTTGALYVVYFGTIAAAAADYDVVGTARLRFLA